MFTFVGTDLHGTAENSKFFGAQTPVSFLAGDLPDALGRIRLDQLPSAGVPKEASEGADGAPRGPAPRAGRFRGESDSLGHCRDTRPPGQ
jgi:hypothetical protein